MDRKLAKIFRSPSRRRFVTGVGAAVGLSIAGGQAPAGASTSPFPEVPDADVTTTEDRPPNATPLDPADTEGNWTDPLGHTVVRGGFGQWITYDDSAGLAGGAVSPAGPFGVGSSPRYPDIELLRMNDGTPVRTPEDWWTRRRPEIFRDVQECLYGHIPPRELWPEITWSAGPVTTGTANGVPYRERVVTGTIDVSGHPSVRNRPMVQGTLRTPLPAGEPVPVIIVFGGNNGEWRFTAPHGMGVCAFNWSALQPDRGGADMSSWIIGLINKGRWRSPRDWGALAAWSWGVSRLIDYFETDPDVDATRIGVQGHSRFGKATLVWCGLPERRRSARHLVGADDLGREPRARLRRRHRVPLGQRRHHEVRRGAAAGQVLAAQGLGPAGRRPLGDVAHRPPGRHDQRRHREGHTPVPDWPSFMELTARHFLGRRPVVTPGQRFRLGDRRPGTAGTVRATDGDGDPLGNWQITGGTGTGTFTIDAATGEIRAARRLGPRRTGRYTLDVTVDDRKLTSQWEIVVIDVPEGA